MKALANITSSAIIAFALAVAVAPLAWGSTGSVASEVAVLFAHSDAVSATTDGSWGYFVGHNPGDFANVMDLTEGDAVMVCVGDGAHYRVVVAC